jgi:multidrug efflux system membrane fusion protein
VSRGGGEGVYLVADSTVVLRSITPGLTESGRVEVLDGLVAGDRVVTAGSNLLRDGGLIRDVSREGGAPGGAAGRAGATGRAGGDR